MDRKLVSVILILIGIVIIVIMAVNILGNKNKVNNEENNVVQNNGTENVNKDTLNYVTKADGSKENISEKVKQEQTVSNLTITNTKIVYENGAAKLTADIVNTSGDTDNLKIKVTLLGNASQIIGEKQIEVGPMKANETKTITIDSPEDITNASSIKYEIVK